MRCRVYRSLDNPPSLLGLKGAYMLWCLAALGASTLVSVLVGSLTSSIVGTLLFLAGGVASYLAVTVLQGRYSEKELHRLLSAFRLHRWILMQPQRFPELWS